MRGPKSVTQLKKNPTSYSITKDNVGLVADSAGQVYVEEYDRSQRMLLQATIKATTGDPTTIPPANQLVINTVDKTIKISDGTALYALTESW